MIDSGRDRRSNALDGCRARRPSYTRGITRNRANRNTGNVPSTFTNHRSDVQSDASYVNTRGRRRGHSTRASSGCGNGRSLGNGCTIRASVLYC